MVERARGLTLAELRQVAREAGIDERFVEMAAAEAGSPIDADPSRFLGGPTSFRHRMRMEGEISDRAREEIIVALRSHMSAHGVLADVYGRMEWSLNDGMGPMVVGVTSRDGETEVDMVLSRSGEPGLYFGLGLPLGGILGGLILTKTLGLTGAAAIPMMGLSTAGAYSALRVLWKARSKYWEGRAARLVGTIGDIVRRRALPPAPETDSESGNDE